MVTGKFRTLALLGAPLDFDVSGGAFRFRELVERADLADLPDGVGDVPGDPLLVAFTLVDPVEFYLARRLRPSDPLEDRGTCRTSRGGAGRRSTRSTSRA